MKNLVSIVIPIYNSEKYLVRCLESIMSQSYSNIEIILINDGSIDTSEEICRHYSEIDTRVLLISTENHGVSAARNIGLNIANGDYITFVDSDDYVDNCLISNLYNAALKYPADLVVSALASTENHESFSVSIEFSAMDEIMFLMRNYLIFGPTQKLYKKDILDTYRIRFPADFSYGEDLLFNIEYLKKINKITYINHVMYHYERGVNPDSLSEKRRWNMYQNDMYFNAQLKAYFEERDLVNKESESFVANRIFDTAYNSICLAFNKESPWKLNELYPYFHAILYDSLTEWALTKANVSLYPGWLVVLIKKKCCFLLMCISAIKRRTK